jgi:hypothetical protein
VLKIKAGNASVMERASNAVEMTPLAQEYSKARNLKPLYDRLSAPGGAATGEAKWFLYKLMATCGRLADAKAPPGPPGKDLATRRRELETMIPASHPDREKRLQLFDQQNARCEGIDLTTTRADLDKLLADAAAAGDPKAQARLATPRSTQPPNGDTQNNLSDDQFHTLQTAISSRDPEAIMIAGMALSNSFDDAVLQVGPDHDQLQERASLEAWRLVACAYGADCGPNNGMLVAACVGSGQCAANTVQDQVFYYNVSPYEAQLIDRYRQIFTNAVANNDWSGLQLSRQPNTSSSRYHFGTSP